MSGGYWFVYNMASLADVLAYAEKQGLVYPLRVRMRVESEGEEDEEYPAYAHDYIVPYNGSLAWHVYEYDWADPIDGPKEPDRFVVTELQGAERRLRGWMADVRQESWCAPMGGREESAALLSEVIADGLECAEREGLRYPLEVVLWFDDKSLMHVVPLKNQVPQMLLEEAAPEGEDETLVVIKEFPMDGTQKAERDWERDQKREIRIRVGKVPWGGPPLTLSEEQAKLPVAEDEQELNRLVAEGKDKGWLELNAIMEALDDGRGFRFINPVTGKVFFIGGKRIVESGAADENSGDTSETDGY
jgi:hypothetical protein